jgi:glutamyl-tRNA(Gln) amidotransferase subunit E
MQFENIMEEDYKKIGLKAGLEIHQQLNTNKLFCNCPSLLRSDKPKYTIQRKLNPVIGETKIIDAAAAYEKTKNKTFEYKVFDTNCLVELDEEPPHEINMQALKIVMQISHLLNAKIFPVTQIMRKTVIDGSNTSGFQRTAMISHDGYIQTSEGKVGIESISIEEDSARKSESTENKTVYSLDRLGIPLIEITTKPDLKSPEQIKEAALKLGEILRACNVKRGIGTIRQDVNISIKGSKRVEIKGFQDPKLMIKTINTEIKRQQECLKDSSCKNEVRKSLPDATTEFLRPMQK